MGEYTNEALIARLRMLLKLAECPIEGCEDGIIPVQFGPDEWEATECQWCLARKEVCDE